MTKNPWFPSQDQRWTDWLNNNSVQEILWATTQKMSQIRRRKTGAKIKLPVHYKNGLKSEYIGLIKKFKYKGKLRCYCQVIKSWIEFWAWGRYGGNDLKYNQMYKNLFIPNTI